MNELGYCCINLSINEGLKKNNHVKVNRGMIKKTFLERGLEYVSELMILNLKDTIKVLQWNVRNDIRVYRLSSDSFPWLTECNIEDLPNFEEISSLLMEIGNVVKDNDLRCGYHPGPFNVLGSDNPRVVEKTIHELDFTSNVLDLMGLDQTPYYGVNIHLNTTKPNVWEASERFCKNFPLLSESTQRRLTVENDDKLGQYSVKMLHEMVHLKLNIPIVFDFHHYHYGPKDQTQKEALELALSTWRVKPMTHMSSSRLLESEGVRETAHADFIYEEIPYLNEYEFDCEIEAKAKDLAVARYKKDFSITE